MAEEMTKEAKEEAKKAEALAREEAKKAEEDAKIPYEVRASFSAKDEEGNKVLIERTASGKSYKEAVIALDFPKGIVALVKVTLTRGPAVFTKAISPRKAQMIFVEKNIPEFESIFRGV